MKRITIAVLALLVLGATSIKAQGNTYAVARTVSYNPTAGTAGTVTISYKFTGSTQQPPNMCNTPGIQHQPRVSANLLVSGTQTTTQSSQGQYVSPCAEMNQTLSISFDFAAGSCDLTSLGNGNCQLDDAPIVFCTATGHAFGSIGWQDFQFETAVTFSTISALLNSNGLHPQAPYCYAPSMPPDLAPATQASPSVKPGQYVESAFMWREVPSGGSFLLVPWHRAIPIDPETWMPPTFNAPICTNWDAGFRDILWPL